MHDKKKDQDDEYPQEGQMIDDGIRQELLKCLYIGLLNLSVARTLSLTPCPSVWTLPENDGEAVENRLRTGL